MMQFTAKQNTACSDASSCAPATCCAASACTADSAAVCKDTAILAVSFSISILVLVSICIRVFPIIGLLVLLVLAWGLVNGMLLIMMYKLKNAKATGFGSLKRPEGRTYPGIRSGSAFCRAAF